MPLLASGVAVIGGGILGLATARELLVRRPDLGVVVLEKERALATHQTGRSSFVLHSGVYYAPGSLKAQLCVEGVRLMRAYCAEQGITVVECGKLIVAVDDAEVPRLEELHRRGVANGVPGLEQIAARGDPRAGAVRCRGPCAPGAGDGSRRLPARQRARSLATCARVAARSCWGTRSAGSRRRPTGRCALVTSGGAVAARNVIACAGVHADRIARLSGGAVEPRIVPFRGDYYILRPERRFLLNALVYPVPDPQFPFLGIHSTLRPDGEMWLGPNALLAVGRESYGRFDVVPRDLGEALVAPGFRRLAARHWRTGAAEAAQGYSRSLFVRAARRLVPGAPGAGHRPGAVRDPRAGDRARRLARRGLRLRAGRRGAPRPQRSVAGRDVVARDRGSDRRSGVRGVRPLTVCGRGCRSGLRAATEPRRPVRAQDRGVRNSTDAPARASLRGRGDLVLGIVAVAGLVAGGALHLAGSARRRRASSWRPDRLHARAARPRRRPHAPAPRPRRRPDRARSRWPPRSRSASSSPGAVVSVMLAGGNALEAFAAGRARRELRLLIERAPRVALLHRDGAVDGGAGRCRSPRATRARPRGRGDPGRRRRRRTRRRRRRGGPDRRVAARHDPAAAARCAAARSNAGAPFDVHADATGGRERLRGDGAHGARAPSGTRRRSLRIADRYAGIFLPMTLVVAGVAWLASGDAVRALAVLVVATPCPLILAAPVALVAGVSRAAHRGVVVKGAGVMERLGAARTVLVDKTGTLTLGEPEVERVVTFGRQGRGRAARSRRDGRAALDPRPRRRDRPCRPRAQEWRSTSRATRTRRPVRASRGRQRRATSRSAAPHWLERQGCDRARRRHGRSRAQKADGHAVGVIAVDGSVRGGARPRRPGARRRRRDDRLAPPGRASTNVVMATGDRQEAADRRSRARLGIDRVYAGQGPEEKLALVRALQASPETAPVVMVGDGINDAPGARRWPTSGSRWGAREPRSPPRRPTRSCSSTGSTASPRRSTSGGGRSSIARQSVLAGMGLSIVAMVRRRVRPDPARDGAILQEGIDVAVDPQRPPGAPRMTRDRPAARRRWHDARRERPRRRDPQGRLDHAARRTRRGGGRRPPRVLRGALAAQPLPAVPRVGSRQRHLAARPHRARLGRGGSARRAHGARRRRGATRSSRSRTTSDSATPRWPRSRSPWRDADQGRGIGTRLLEQLAARAGGARHPALRRLRAARQHGDARRLLEHRLHRAEAARRGRRRGDVPDRADVGVPLEAPTCATTRAIVASMRPFFEPRSVAVFGASAREGSIGGAVFRNIITGGFDGVVFPVNRDGPPWPASTPTASVEELPEVPELAVVCVPGACGSRRRRAGAAGRARGRSASSRPGSPRPAPRDGPRQERAARPHPRARRPPDRAELPGTLLCVDGAERDVRAALVPGRADRRVVAERRRGARTPRARAATTASASPTSSRSATRRTSRRTTCSSGGRPIPTPTSRCSTSSRSATRCASRASRAASSRRMPVLAMKSGASDAGRRAAGSHTAALASSDATVGALFHQAGVIRADDARGAARHGGAPLEPAPAGRPDGWAC